MSMLLNQIGKGKEVSFEDKLDIKNLKLSELQEHPDNFYDTSDITSLAEDIKENGLNTSITVRKLESTHPLYRNETPYQILVGHRRVLASLQNDSKTINARVVEGLSDHEAYELLISDNALARKLKPHEELLQVEKMNELYEIKKQEGNLKGRVRELVAHKLNMSLSSVGRHQKVILRASDLVMQEIEKENISISSASELVTLDKALQNKFLESHEEYSHADVKKYVDQILNPKNEECVQLDTKQKEVLKVTKSITKSRELFKTYLEDIGDTSKLEDILKILDDMEHHYIQ